VRGGGPSATVLSAGWVGIQEEQRGEKYKHRGSHDRTSG
jgi:hypothetical protein